MIQSNQYNYLQFWLRSIIFTLLEKNKKLLEMLSIRYIVLRQFKSHQVLNCKLVLRIQKNPIVQIDLKVKKRIQNQLKYYLQQQKKTIDNTYQYIRQLSMISSVLLFLITLIIYKTQKIMYVFALKIMINSITEGA